MKLGSIRSSIKTIVRHISSNKCLFNEAIATNVVHPCINLDDNVAYKSSLQHSLLLRNNNENLEELYDLFKKYKHLLNEKSKLSKKRDTINKEIKLSKSDKEFESLKNLGKDAREEFKVLSKQISDFESSLLPRILQLPNTLREGTKESENVINKTQGSLKIAKHDHLVVGKNYGLLDFVDSHTYYLRKQAALYELMFSQYLINFFKNKGFVLFSSPDFSRDSLLNVFHPRDIDCQGVLTLGQAFSVQSDRLHLNGGAHLLPLCAFFLKTIADARSLPLKCVSQGRHFSRSGSNLGGLYSVWQKTDGHLFITCSADQSEGVLQETLDNLWSLYLPLNLPLEMSYRPAAELTPSESARVSLKIYSTYFERFVEVARISTYSEYISRRLRIYNKNNSDEFSHLISGSLGNLPTLLATIFELGPDCNRTIEDHLKIFSKMSPLIV